MRESANYKFNLPDKADQFNLDHWNQNTEKLDEKLKTIDDKDLELNDLINNKFNDLLNGNPSDPNSLYYKLMLKAHPVGSLYWSSKPTNPAELFGGTWTQIKDKFILACGDTYSVNNTGGSAEVTLITNNLPSHTHGAGTLSTSDAGEHTHYYYMVEVEDGPGIPFTGNQELILERVASSSAGNHNHSITGTTASAGSGEAFSNMPPYIVKYCWERVT